MISFLAFTFLIDEWYHERPLHNSCSWIIQDIGTFLENDFWFEIIDFLVMEEIFVQDNSNFVLDKVAWTKVLSGKKDKASVLKHCFTECTLNHGRINVASPFKRDVNWPTGCLNTEWNFYFEYSINFSCSQWF